MITVFNIDKLIQMSIFLLTILALRPECFLLEGERKQHSKIIGIHIS